MGRTTGNRDGSPASTATQAAATGLTIKLSHEGLVLLKLAS